MNHSIKLEDEAFRAYAIRALQLGMTVDEYLNRSAPTQEGFVLTPEMRAAIERGLGQADAGQVVGMEQVRESLSQYRSTWRKKNNP